MKRILFLVLAMALTVHPMAEARPPPPPTTDLFNLRVNASVGGLVYIVAPGAGNMAVSHNLRNRSTTPGEDVCVRFSLKPDQDLALNVPTRAEVHCVAPGEAFSDLVFVAKSMSMKSVAGTPLVSYTATVRSQASETP